MSHPALRIRVPLFSVPILWIFGGASFGATTDNNSKADNMTAPAAGRVVNVTALEANGQSVLDLVISDFRIFEDDKPRPIANFTPLINPRNKNSTPPTTLILFGLLNAFIGQRENSATLILRALQPLDANNTIYLYLLTNHGDLPDVHEQPGEAYPGRNRCGRFSIKRCKSKCNEDPELQG